MTIPNMDLPASIIHNYGRLKISNGDIRTMGYHHVRRLIAKGVLTPYNDAKGRLMITVADMEKAAAVPFPFERKTAVIEWK